MFARGLLYKNGYVKHKTGKADMEQPMFSINMKPDALAPHRWAMEGSQFVLGELMLSTYSTQLYGLKNALVNTLVRLFSDHCFAFNPQMCS